MSVEISRVWPSQIKKGGASQSYLQINKRIPIMLAEDDSVSGCEVET